MKFCLRWFIRKHYFMFATAETKVALQFFSRCLQIIWRIGNLEQILIWWSPDWCLFLVRALDCTAAQVLSVFFIKLNVNFPKLCSRCNINLWFSTAVLSNCVISCSYFIFILFCFDKPCLAQPRRSNELKNAFHDFWSNRENLILIKRSLFASWNLQYGEFLGREFSSVWCSQ